MRSLAYAVALVAVLLVTAPLELVLRVRVYARWRRLLRTVLCAGLPFVGWDLAAVRAGHWRFDPTQVLGVVLPGGLPLEEVLFFVVVPVASVLTLEAVRRVTGWRVDDGDGSADRAPGEPGPSRHRRGW